MSKNTLWILLVVVLALLATPWIGMVMAHYFTLVGDYMCGGNWKC